MFINLFCYLWTTRRQYKDRDTTELPNGFYFFSYQRQDFSKGPGHQFLFYIHVIIMYCTYSSGFFFLRKSLEEHLKKYLKGRVKKCTFTQVSRLWKLTDALWDNVREKLPVIFILYRRQEAIMYWSFTCTSSIDVVTIEETFTEFIEV